VLWGCCTKPIHLQHHSALAAGVLQAGGWQGTSLLHPFDFCSPPSSQAPPCPLQSEGQPSSTWDLSAPFAALTSANVPVITWVLQFGLFNPDLLGVPGQALMLLTRQNVIYLHISGLHIIKRSFSFLLGPKRSSITVFTVHKHGLCFSKCTCPNLQ